MCRFHKVILLSDRQHSSLGVMSDLVFCCENVVYGKKYARRQPATSDPGPPDHIARIRRPDTAVTTSNPKRDSVVALQLRLNDCIVFYQYTMHCPCV
jgi:hypothetical protein